MSEERLAKALNIAMAAVLAALVIAFAIWALVTEAVPVIAIFQRLAPDQQTQVLRLLNSILFVMFGTVMASKWLGSWRRRASAARRLTPS